MLLSVIIPAYNEERTLTNSLARLAEFLVAKRYRSEVIVINDGSTDRTQWIAEQQQQEYQRQGLVLRVLSNVINCGKGYSVRKGMVQAQGRIALFIDADLPAALDYIDLMVAPILLGNCDLVFGSRALPQSRALSKKPIFRDIAGRAFNILVRTLTNLEYNDTQYGLKAFNLARARVLFEQQTIDGFAFDAEILWMAKQHKLRISGIPITWSNKKESSVGLVAGMRSFYDLFKFSRSQARKASNMPLTDHTPLADHKQLF